MNSVEPIQLYDRAIAESYMSSFREQWGSDEGKKSEQKYAPNYSKSIGFDSSIESCQSGYSNAVQQELLSMRLT